MTSTWLKNLSGGKDVNLLSIFVPAADFHLTNLTHLCLRHSYKQWENGKERNGTETTVTFYGVRRRKRDTGQSRVSQSLSSRYLYQKHKQLNTEIHHSMAVNNCTDLYLLTVGLSVKWADLGDLGGGGGADGLRGDGLGAQQHPGVFLCHGVHRLRGRVTLKLQIISNTLTLFHTIYLLVKTQHRNLRAFCCH